jgi:two-component system, cell cycle sensor histidine kinase and response regulator CckA
MHSPRIAISPRIATHRRKISAAARTLRKAVEQCQELVFVTDLEGSIQYANPACETLTGYKTPELLETGLDGIGVALSPGQSWRFLRDRALESGVFRGSLGIRCKNGSVAELDLAITVVRDPRTGTTSLVCTGLTIALQREISERTEQPQPIDPIGAMASGVAHDFNNLLMVIGAYAEMGLAAVPAEHTAQRNFQEILTTVRKASDLTRRLMMIGRRPGKGPQLVSINWIVEDTAAMLSRIMEEDIEIRVSLGKGVGLVRADPGQIEQVLLNLAVNARDAMPHGGQFTIETESVQLDRVDADEHYGTKPGAHVLLTVSDSGQGMRPDQLSRIFQPYYTTKPPGKGTGLGLAIVKSIVQQNAGYICADSEPCIGTRFRIYLPVEVHIGKKLPASLRQEIVVPRGDESLLIVEDSEPIRRATAQFLSSLGYKVTLAANGEDGLRLSENNPQIDLIITDVVMPRMNGPDFAGRVAPRLHAKTLFTSGHTENVLLRKGMAASNSNFLPKPFSLDKLAVKIREVLDEPVPLRAIAAAAGR